MFNEHPGIFDEYLYGDGDDNDENYMKMSRKRYRKRNPKFADYDHYDYSDEFAYPLEMQLYLTQPQQQFPPRKKITSKMPHWGGYGPRCPRQPMHDVTHVQHVKEIICDSNDEFTEQIQIPILPKIQNLRELRDRLDNMTKALSSVPPVSGNTDVFMPYKLVSVFPQNVPPVFQPSLPTLQQLTSLANNFPPFAQYSIPPVIQQSNQNYNNNNKQKVLRKKQNLFVQKQHSFSRSFCDGNVAIKRQKIDGNEEGENSSMFIRDADEKIEDSWQSSLNTKINNNNNIQLKQQTPSPQKQKLGEQQFFSSSPQIQQQNNTFQDDINQTQIYQHNACITESPKLSQINIIQQNINNKQLFEQSINNPIGQCKLDEFLSFDLQKLDQNSGNKPVKQIFSMLKRGLINIGDVVEYHGKKECEIKARGEITYEGIKCWRCKGVVGTSFFENHCAGSTLRRPAENIYVIKLDSNQRVLLQTLIDDLNPEKMRKRQKKWSEKQQLTSQLSMNS
eukprot:TRINITY_DN2426_c0_g2_i2.p1 TRINITY_DN2426_c0_g2~~TRINITY_DN2426_c0_g2_i2.p1  ORF type:complete len:505 (+),score=72.08 TRINITY_DN2426_c0_g2_i2:844-2358(+)